MYPRRRRWLCLLGSRAKKYTLQGSHRRFVGDSALHTYFGRAPLLVGETAEVVLPSATSTEFDPYSYIPYTGTLVVYSSLYLLSTECVFSSHSFWTSSSLDVPAGVTQEEGHTGLLILARRVLLYTTYCLKKNAVVHQSVLVEYYYCCFHLNYGTTTVGPDIVIRNKKRSLLCTPHPQ